MKKEGRGSHDEKVEQSKGIVVVRWFDNKAVTLVSSYCGAMPLKTAKRWDKKENKYIIINKPKLVDEYNIFMGGVDLMDMLSSLYRYQIKSRRWYLYIWLHTLTVALVNSWLLYRRQHPGEKIMKLRTFQAQIAEGLLKAGQSKMRGRPSQSPCPVPRKRPTPLPIDEVRFDGFDHLPDWDSEHRQRCKLCSEFRSHIICSKCQVYLCVNKDRNCFQSYHTKK